ncbi:MAG: GDSL-type esterase/lipase family protein, partial [Pirellulales bacterium]
RKAFGEAATLNRGFGGSQYADIVRYADRLIKPYQARAIVLYSGDNDLWHGKTPEEVHRDFLSVVKAIREHQADVPIVVIGVKPSIARRKIDDQIRQTNRLMAESTAMDARMAFVDPYQFMLDGDGKANRALFVGDGLHLNAAGYALWTPQVQKAIDDLEAATVAGE